MAEAFFTNAELGNQQNLSPAIPLNGEDFIDLTESDDLTTSKPSVSSHTSDSVSTENGVTQHEGGHESSETDESLSIVYENINPQPPLELINIADDISIRLIKDDSGSCHGQVSKKVRIGSKCVNLSISVSSKGKETGAGLRIINKVNPVAVEEPESQKNTKIDCGICLDSVQEISASDRKLLATVCGHVFCCTCFEKFMQTSKLCPKCRKRLTKRQVHPLYL